MADAKLLLTAIFKDDTEYDMIERMLGSFMPYMHGLAVVITGVSGKHARIKALVKRYGGAYLITTPATHPDIYHKTDTGYIFANFAAARNTAFRLAAEQPTSYDYWMWADADDVLLGGDELQQVALRAMEQKLDSVFFTYWYSVALDDTGNIKDVAIEHLRERMLRPNIFKWVSRLHEVAVPIDGNYQPKHSLYDYKPEEGRRAAWAHIVDQLRIMQNMQRNIDLLTIQVEEEQYKDPRTIFYLAKTYYDMRTPEYDQKSEALIRKYLELSGWQEERGNAWEYLGNLRARANDHRGAIECYHNAIKEWPSHHMPYLRLAGSYAELGLHEQSTFWLDTVLRMDKPATRTTIGNPLEIKVIAASLKYNHAMRVNNVEEAIRWKRVRNQLLGETDDGMLKVLEDAKLMNDAAIWAFNYAKWLKDTGHIDKVKHVVASLPQELGREAFAQFLANEVAEPRVWGEREICYYASFGGEHFEQWGPQSLKRGIGGSETAVIELAKRWAKQGYKVTVFGDPRGEAGEHEGVTYKPWYQMNWKDEFNILILWRAPYLLDKDIKAKKILMDLHDIASQLDWNESRMLKVSQVFFKSQAHRKMLPKLPDTKAVVISNGI